MEKGKIKLIKSLDNKRRRNEAGMFVVEGVKMVEEMLKSSLNVKEIFFTERCDISSFDTAHLCKVEQISDSDMDRISHLNTPSSILAIIEIPTTYKIDLNSEELYLALDGVQDPGNMGTIIRICDWYGITNIFASNESADIFNPKVVQATMGAISRVKVVYCDLEMLITDAKNMGIPSYTTALDGENMYSSEISSGGIIIMGNEGHGVSQAVQQMSSSKLYIPSYPAESVCESLNVGVATAIICAEFRRRISING